MSWSIRAPSDSTQQADTVALGQLPHGRNRARSAPGTSAARGIRRYRLPSPVRGARRPSLPPRVFLPDEFGADQDRGRLARGVPVARIARWAAYAGAGLFGSRRPVSPLCGARIACGDRGPRRARPRPWPASSLARLDRALIRSAWRSPRSTCGPQLFASRQMHCPSWRAGSSRSKNVGPRTTAWGRRAVSHSTRLARPGTGRCMPMSTGSRSVSSARACSRP